MNDILTRKKREAVTLNLIAFVIGGTFYLCLMIGCCQTTQALVFVSY